MADFIVFLHKNIMSSELSEGEALLLQRLDEFVDSNSIDLLAFWKTNRLCLTLDEFFDLLNGIGFTVTVEDLQQLVKENVEFVNLESILMNVPTWKKKDATVSDFIFRQEREEDAAKSKVTKKGRDSRANTLSSFGDYTSSRMKAAERQWKKESQLNETLIRARNQSDYQLTIKVGEANDICKKLKNECSFLIDSATGEARIVEVKTKTGEETILPRKLFEKRYEQLKAASLVRGQQVEGTLQEDLKKVLVEVMYLSGQLEEQIRLLESKGVSH